MTSFAKSDRRDADRINERDRGEHDTVTDRKRELEENPGYHLTKIKKGIFGQPDKIYEEVEELKDALLQNNLIMALNELSDLYGAIKGYLKTHISNVSMDDLKIMSEATERAFKTGQRT